MSKSTLSSGEIIVIKCSGIERKYTIESMNAPNKWVWKLRWKNGCWKRRINTEEVCENLEIKEKDNEKGSPKIKVIMPIKGKMSLCW